jgi:hypothetical protein
LPHDSSRAWKKRKRCRQDHGHAAVDSFDVIKFGWDLFLRAGAVDATLNQSIPARSQSGMHGSTIFSISESDIDWRKEEQIILQHMKAKAEINKCRYEYWSDSMISEFYS